MYSSSHEIIYQQWHESIAIEEPLARIHLHLLEIDIAKFPAITSFCNRQKFCGIDLKLANRDTEASIATPETRLQIFSVTSKEEPPMENPTKEVAVRAAHFV